LLEQIQRLVTSICEAIAKAQPLQAPAQFATSGEFAEAAGPGAADLVVKSASASVSVSVSVNVNEPGAAPLSPQALIAALSGLRQSLVDADAKACAQMEALHPQVSAGLWRQLTPALTMINQYQYDEAIEVIDSVLQQLA
ncbi:MAG: hypothetical protein ACRDBI_15060, partial [Shewanella sp.]